MVFIATPNEGLKIHCQDGKTLGQIFEEKTKGQGPTRVIRNFYSGFVPTALRDVPYVMLYFPFYEALRRKFTPVGQEPTTRKLIVYFLLRCRDLKFKMMPPKSVKIGYFLSFL